MTIPCTPSTASEYTAASSNAASGLPPFNQLQWTIDEHNNFLEGLKEFGRSWESISLHLVPTRTTEQVKNYAAHYFYKQAQDATLGAAKPAHVRNTSAEDPEKKDNGHWTDEEHEFFLECWAKYGKSWKKISEVMKTRTNEQVRTHAQKYFAKLKQLRTCGYEGNYAMDGTRHLTKTFLKKAQRQGRISPGKLKTSFKMTSSRSVVKKRGNRQGKAVARLRGGSSALHRVMSQGGEGWGEEEAERENKDAEKEGEEKDGSLLQLAMTSYTTRSGRVVTWAQPLQQALAQAQATMDMEGDEAEGGTTQEGVDDRKQQAAPTVVMAAPVGLTMDTGASQEGEGEEIMYDVHHGHENDQHDAKQEEQSERVNEVVAEIDAAAEVVTVAPTLPTVADIMTSLTMDPHGFLHWGDAGPVPEGWVMLPEVVDGRTDMGSLSTATITTHAPAEMISSTSSSGSTVSSDSSSSNSSSSEGATQRDSMLLMMSNADGSLLWESDGYNAEEDDNNSLTRLPTSPVGDAATASWVAEEEDFWEQAEGGKGEGEASTNKDGAAVFQI